MKTILHETPRTEIRRAAARKLFYRIQEVAKLTGLKPYVLRYWETEFKELAPAKDGSDQRRYRQADIEVVLAIRKLLYEDRFTIEGARKRLREELRRVRGEESDQQAAEVVAISTLAPEVTSARAEALPVSGPGPIALKTPVTEAQARAVEEERLREARLEKSLSRLKNEVSELLSFLQ